MLTILCPAFPSHNSGITPFFHLPENNFSMVGLIERGSVPINSLVPIVTVSGRSVLSRNVKQGTPIILSLAGANRDPDANENPETLDLQRTKVKHLAFGRGIHHCIGAHLGSAEIKAIFKYLIENIPQLKNNLYICNMRELHGNSQKDPVYGYLENPRELLFIDMDGVIADAEAGMKVWSDKLGLSTDDLFKKKLYHMPGFYLDLPPMEGAIEAFNKWKENYKQHGYYSSVKYGRIHLDDLIDYCEFKTL